MVSPRIPWTTNRKVVVVVALMAGSVSYCSLPKAGLLKKLPSQKRSSSIMQRFNAPRS